MARISIQDNCWHNALYQTTISNIPGTGKIVENFNVDALENKRKTPNIQ